MSEQLSLLFSRIIKAVRSSFLMSFSSWLTKSPRIFPSVSHFSIVEVKNLRIALLSTSGHSSIPSIRMYVFDTVVNAVSRRFLDNSADVNNDWPLRRHCSYIYGSKSSFLLSSWVNSPRATARNVFL